MMALVVIKAFGLLTIWSSLNYSKLRFFGIKICHCHTPLFSAYFQARTFYVSSTGRRLISKFRWTKQLEENMLFTIYFSSNGFKRNISWNVRSFKQRCYFNLPFLSTFSGFFFQVPRSLAKKRRQIVVSVTEAMSALSKATQWQRALDLLRVAKGKAWRSTNPEFPSEIWFNMLYLSYIWSICLIYLFVKIDFWLIFFESCWITCPFWWHDDLSQQLACHRRQVSPDVVLLSAGISATEAAGIINFGRYNYSLSCWKGRVTFLGQIIWKWKAIQKPIQNPFESYITLAFCIAFPMDNTGRSQTPRRSLASSPTAFGGCETLANSSSLARYCTFADLKMTCPNSLRSLTNCQLATEKLLFPMFP